MAAEQKECDFCGQPAPGCHLSVALRCMYFAHYTDAQKARNYLREIAGDPAAVASLLAEAGIKPHGVPVGVAQSQREEAKQARPPSDEEPWVVADDDGVRVTFRTEDAAWRYRNDNTDRLTNPTVTYEPATSGVPGTFNDQGENRG